MVEIRSGALNTLRATFVALVLILMVWTLVVYISNSKPLGKPESRDYLSVDKYGYGYVLELHSSDQLTSGALNVLCLQCLARQIHPKVKLVEPFLVYTVYGASLESGDKEWLARENNVRLRDIIDINDWKRFTEQRQYAEMTTWEDFLETAPRDVILVQNQFSLCSPQSLEKKFSPFFELFQFKVVRLACLQFEKRGALNLTQFKQAVYGNYSPPAVTVIFDRFPGIGDAVHRYTTTVIGTVCKKGKMTPYSYFKPSARVIADAKTFTERYLGGRNNYVSVMFRSVLAIMALRYNASLIRSKCLDQAIDEWKAMKSKFRLNNTYFTNDLFVNGPIGKVSPPLIGNLTQMLYGNERYFDEWKKGFEEVAGLNNSRGAPGYITIFQKVVATQARCLVLIGGGSFQANALNWYNMLHTEADSRCYARWDSYCRRSH